MTKASHLLTALTAAAGLMAAAPPEVDPNPVRYQKLLNQYCLGCHNQKLSTAGVSLQGLDLSNPGEHAAVWEKVLRKVHSGQMPPAGLPRPNASASAGMSAWLERELDLYAAAKPNPGRPAVHRLNRAEYSNAIRDLLAVDIQPGDSLPVDDSGYGFDNIGDVLTMSPALLERYMSSARRISRLAVGDQKIKPAEDSFDAPRDLIRQQGATGPRNEPASEDLPFNSRGGMSISYYFPMDAEYVFRIKTNANPDVKELAKTFEWRMPVPAGLHRVGLAFPRASAKPEVSSSARPRRSDEPPVAVMQPPTFLDLRLDGKRVQRFDIPERRIATDVSTMKIAGPFSPAGPGTTPSRQRIFVCEPAADSESRPCAEKILGQLARRAFRRLVTAADLRPLLAFYEAGKAEGGFDRGIESALQAVLVSPDFLFRVEHEPTGLPPGAAFRVSDTDLASRLSFFLWSSIPDDRLLDLAEGNKLRQPEVLAAEVRRMLADPKSDALVNNFAGQWLYLRNLAAVRPDPDEFPTFDDPLRRAFAAETTLFFQSVLRENRSILDLLDANYTFLNQRLAEHYGIRGVYGPQFRRVQLSDPNRGGLLGQGSILTVTSYPNRTSVVQRGKWVLENLLGAPPPPPPPDIPDLMPHDKDGKTLTMREAMEQHRANPTCASCHARMDPIGFALENYDGIGTWRTEDEGSPIDSSGKLPDGTSFQGPAGLKKILLSNHRDEFVETFTEKLLTYALGRGVEYYDRPAIRSIDREAEKDAFRISTVVTAIVKSTPFQMRRTSDQ